MRGLTCVVFLSAFSLGVLATDPSNPVAKDPVTELKRLQAKYDCAHVKPTLQATLDALEAKIISTKTKTGEQCETDRQHQHRLYEEATRDWVSKRTADQKRVSVEEESDRRVRVDVHGKTTTAYLKHITDARMEIDSRTKKLTHYRANHKTKADLRDVAKAKKDTASEAHVGVKKEAAEALVAVQKTLGAQKTLRDEEAQKIYTLGTTDSRATSAVMLAQCKASYDEVTKMISSSQDVLVKMSEIWGKIKQTCIPVSKPTTIPKPLTLLEVSGTSRALHSGTCAQLRRKAQRWQGELQDKLDRTPEVGEKVEAAMSLLELRTLRGTRSRRGTVMIPAPGRGEERDLVKGLADNLDARLASATKAYTSCKDSLESSSTAVEEAADTVRGASLTQSTADYDAGVAKVETRWAPDLKAADFAEQSAVAALKIAEAEVLNAASDVISCELSLKAAQAVENEAKDQYAAWLPIAKAKLDADLTDLKSKLASKLSDINDEWLLLSGPDEKRRQAQLTTINADCEVQAGEIQTEFSLIMRFRNTVAETDIATSPPVTVKLGYCDTAPSKAGVVCCLANEVACKACAAGAKSVRNYCLEDDTRCSYAGCITCNPKCGGWTAAVADMKDPKPISTVTVKKVGCEPEAAAVLGANGAIKVLDELIAMLHHQEKGLVTSKAECADPKYYNCAAENTADEKKVCEGQKAECVKNTEVLEQSIQTLQAKHKANGSVEHLKQGAKTAQDNKALCCSTNVNAAGC